MGRKRKGDKVDGWINLDKPAGLNSTQAVGRVRRLLNAQKAGHAGTLDPLATGILPIALGEATKTISFMQDAIKTYSFTICWGEHRDTLDSEGVIQETSDTRPGRGTIEAALSRFTGDIMQIPPQFSAIKVDGARAYDLARSGEDFELAPRPVYIEQLELLDSTANTADFRMICGKGTYVRSLARDLAAELGALGYISALRREAVGPFSSKDAISLDFLEQISDSAALDGILLPLDSALDDILALPINDNEARRLRNGQVLSFVSRPDFSRLERLGLGLQGFIDTALAINGGDAVALVEVEGSQIRPVRVFNV